MVDNVSIAGNVLVLGRRATLTHVSARGIAISGASKVSVSYAQIRDSAEDGIHVTSDRGPVSDVVLAYNYVHAPDVPYDAHYDGTQVRGAERLVISCSTYDLGVWKPQYNAAIYLENANGGVRDVRIADNWINGGGYALMLDGDRVLLDGNTFGDDAHWGLCEAKASFTRGQAPRMRANVDARGRALTPCGA
ncbi:right-handed parallel beta-helix repeat-containing protein [Terrabacter aerolatus]|uniref:right-handed parallel beta-helix repeat-containing protein n=1 Tax=Terrabacter aerolatus TaxID=422442 RepID=UPI0011BD8F73|nr:right-handed parallel beta-helix repeat-containing protein [Terrabacter aerolatus]